MQRGMSTMYATMYLFVCSFGSISTLEHFPLHLVVSFHQLALPLSLSVYFFFSWFFCLFVFTLIKSHMPLIILLMLSLFASNFVAFILPAHSEVQGSNGLFNFYLFWSIKSLFFHAITGFSSINAVRMLRFIFQFW